MNGSPASTTTFSRPVFSLMTFCDLMSPRAKNSRTVRRFRLRRFAAASTDKYSITLESASMLVNLRLCGPHHRSLPHCRISRDILILAFS